MEAAASIVAKVVLLADAVSEFWINVSAVNSSACNFDVAVRASVTPCGLEQIPLVVWFVSLFTGYGLPPLNSVMEGISTTYVGPVPL